MLNQININVDSSSFTSIFNKIKCVYFLYTYIANYHNYFPRLTGVITFSSDHFVTHCRRSTGRWELLNDLHLKITKSNLNKDIEPHLAMYIQQ